jgi:pimeloyl-ACP methyl ester carboxylesterase
VPLLLIPGAFQSTTSMTQWVAAVVAKRPVIVFDQQGHGQTADTPRAMSYEQFADDAAALLQALAVERADVMGYSQGGAVALQLALRHPRFVGKLIVLGAPYRRDGWYPSVWQGLEHLSADFFAATPVSEAFRRHTVDPEAFVAYVEKMRVLGIADQNISDAEMHSIQAKTMVVVGDADGVRPEHAIAMFRLRGGGDEQAAATGAITGVPPARLVILPATSHTAIPAAVPVLEPMITEFLDDVPPANPALW